MVLLSRGIYQDRFIDALRMPNCSLTQHYDLFIDAIQSCIATY